MADSGASGRSPTAASRVLDKALGEVQGLVAEAVGLVSSRLAEEVVVVLAAHSSLAALGQTPASAVSGKI